MKIKNLKFKIILLSFIFCLLYSAFLAPSALAQSENPTASPSPIVTNPNTTPNTNPDVPKNLHNWTQNVMIEVMLSLTCQLVGIDPTQPNGQCLGVDQKTGKIGFLPAGNIEKGEIGGAIGGMNNMITMLYTPPLRTGDYFQYLAQNFGVVKSAHAQTGTGFDSLKPLQKLWSAFRNIVYLIFVIVFVVIGLAIMLRIKIDPRTVMTIQNQIPKIIIGILLVTFSFAIAGFLVDMMWVVTYLVFGIIADANVVDLGSIKELSPLALQGKSPLSIGIGQIGVMSHDVANSSTEIVQDLLGIKTGTGEAWKDLKDVFASISFTSLITNPLSIIPTFLSFFPKFATAVGELFKGVFPASVTFGLLPDSKGIVQASAINSIISLISLGTSAMFFINRLNMDFPSILGFDLGLLGNAAIASVLSVLLYTTMEWFLRFGVPYLIVFIIIFIALLIALFRLWFVLLMTYINILIDVVLAPFWIVGSLVPGSPVSATGWLRDLIANLAAFPAVIGMLLLGRVFMGAFQGQTNAFVPPLIGNLSGATNTIGSLIGIGIILMTPNVVSMVKAAIKAPKLDTGLGKAFAPGVAIPTGTARSIGQTIMGGSEWVPDPTVRGGWRRRGRGLAFLGGIFRR